MAWDDIDSFYDDEYEYRYDYDAECWMCDEGLLKLEFISESQDNYCLCDMGEELRRERFGGDED